MTEDSLSLELSSRENHQVWTETVLLSVINVAAFFGNLSVCFAVYRNQRLRTLANMFVVALAVSDILMSTCCMPLSVVTLYRGRWIFASSFCRFHGFTVFTFGMVSLHTMGIIAVSRYFCVVKQNKYIALFTPQSVLLYIIAVWCGAFIGSVPPLFFQNGGFQFQAGKAMCLYTFEINVAFTAFITCVYIATPFAIISICYAKVFYTVSRTNQVFSQENNPQQFRANVEEAKVTKTVAAVMVGFTFCWLPICIMDYIDGVRGQHTLPRKVYLTYGFLIYLSSTINPFIYGATNKRFRREFKVILKKVLCLQSLRCTRISDRDSGSEGRRTRLAQATSQDQWGSYKDKSIYIEPIADLSKITQLIF